MFDNLKMDEIIEISLHEVDVFEREIISFHIPHSKKLNDDHKYFSKRIVWTLVKWIDTEDYPWEDIEEDERNGIRMQEISGTIVNEINGITNDFIKDKINLGNCFQFEFNPCELDKLFLKSDYEFKEIKSMKRPYYRGWEYISLTYRNGIWEIDENVEKRVIKKLRQGLLNIKRTHNTGYTT